MNSIRNFVLFVSVTLFFIFVCYDAQAKKIISFGLSDPNTAYLVENINDTIDEPFDGTVFTGRPSDGNDAEFTWNCWGSTTYTHQQMQEDVNNLQAVNFKWFNDNFLRMNATPGNVDWFDNFDVIINNFGTGAWIVAEGGQKGIMLDLESYEGQLWDYREQTRRDDVNFSDYQAQVRLRGQQIMDAIQDEMPDITIFLPIAYSYVWRHQINGNVSQLPVVEYGLLPSFIDGLIDAADSGVQFIDGTEQSYLYKYDYQFTVARTYFTTSCLPIVADDSKYAAKFKLAFGLYMDYGWRTDDWYIDPDYFNLNYFEPDEFEIAIRRAHREADEYVWIWIESMKWWPYNGGKGIPQAYDDAVRNAWVDGSMDPVHIDWNGNADDNRSVSFNGYTDYYGGVGYGYQIGKYEVTNEQYCAFLNAVAASDPCGLYNTNMSDSSYPNRGGITRSGTSGSYTYAAIDGREKKPINWVTWRSAARYCNWMHNGKRVDPDTIKSGVYNDSTFTGTGWNKNDQAARSTGAKYFLPTVDEWYKAALYQPGGYYNNYWVYPTQSYYTAPSAGPYDTSANRCNYQADNFDFGDGTGYGDFVDVGFYTLTPSSFGTFDQAGNVFEYCENWAPGESGYCRIMYGGAWKWNDYWQLRYDVMSHSSPDTGYYERGFRLAGGWAGQ